MKKIMMKKVAKKVVAKKKEPKATLDNAADVIKSKHTEAMMSVEVCKSIVKDLDVEYKMLSRKSQNPRVLIKLNNMSYSIGFSGRNDSVMVHCEHESEIVLFAIPMEDNYLERIKKISK